MAIKTAGRPTGESYKEKNVTYGCKSDGKGGTLMELPAGPGGEKNKSLTQKDYSGGLKHQAVKQEKMQSTPPKQKIIK